MALDGRPMCIQSLTEDGREAKDQALVVRFALSHVGFERLIRSLYCDSQRASVVPMCGQSTKAVCGDGFFHL